MQHKISKCNDLNSGLRRCCPHAGGSTTQLNTETPTQHCPAGHCVLSTATLGSCSTGCWCASCTTRPAACACATPLVGAHMHSVSNVGLGVKHQLQANKHWGQACIQVREGQLVGDCNVLVLACVAGQDHYGNWETIGEIVPQSMNHSAVLEPWLGMATTSKLRLQKAAHAALALVRMVQGVNTSKLAIPRY